MFLEDILVTLSPTQITNYFCIILILLFITGLFLPKESNIPTLLTSIGILGTFTGIVVGLLNFNIDSIDQSISMLLGGMKTAFLTSVIGLFLSITFKLIQPIFTHTIHKKLYTSKKVERDLNIDKIIENFYHQTEILVRQDSNIEKLAQSIGGNSEVSIIGQLKFLRSDLSDNNRYLIQKLESIIKNDNEINEIVQRYQTEFTSFKNQLWDKLENFANILSKSATETVIEALKNVIADFNQNLTEQFGENFKELNKAVGALIEWQNNYTQQLNEMIVLFDKKVSSLFQTEQAILNIENSAKSIPKSMEELNKVIIFNKQQLQELNAHLEAFSLLRDNAVQAIPEIQNQITLMLENTTSANEAFLSVLKEGSENIRSSISDSSNNLIKAITNSGETFTNSLQTSSTLLTNTLSNNHSQLTNNSDILMQTAQTILQHQKDLIIHQQKSIDQVVDFISQWQQKFEIHTTDIQQHFTILIEKTMKTHMEEHSRLMGRLEKESESALSRTGESIDKQIKALDQALEIELNRVMNDMGMALATISNKFTQDYSKLVDAMSRIVNQQNKR